MASCCSAGVGAGAAVTPDGREGGGAGGDEGRDDGDDGRAVTPEGDELGGAAVTPDGDDGAGPGTVPRLSIARRSRR